MIAGCEFKIQPNGCYHCVVTNLTITKKDTEVVKFEANAMTLTKLMIQNQDIHFFPKNLSKIFPNLQELEISHCKLKEIEADDLKGFDKLITLSLANNCLKYLPDDLFKHVPNLQYADFSNNNISLRLLDPLRNHRHLELQGNKIKNIKF